MSENSLAEQERTERARVFEEAANNLQFSMRDFLLDTYLRAIPAEKFCDFWCALCFTPPDKKYHAVAEFDNIKKYIDFDKIGLHDTNYSNTSDVIRSVCAAPPDEELRRNVLGCLDLTAFFKFEYVDNKMQTGSTYDLLKLHYARVKIMGRDAWKKLNGRARSGRNGSIGHPNSHTFRSMTVAEWRIAMDAWIEIADCLHDAQNDALYQRIQADAAQAEKNGQSSLYSLTELAQASGRFTAEEVSEILTHYRYQCINGNIFCNKEEALQCLSDHAHTRDMEKALASLQKEKSSARAALPKASESAVIRTVFEHRLQKVAPLDRLLHSTGEPLTGHALQELAETHYLVLTASLLKSKDGRRFILSSLFPALRLAKRDPKEALIVDSTTLYHLYQEREEYDRLSGKYRTTLWTPQREEERVALNKRCRELRDADSAYFFVQDLQLPPLGSPDPLSTDEESLLAVLEAHPFDRFCILLCGKAGIVRKIDRDRLPFVQVGRVRAGAEQSVCSLFPQLLPPARADKEDPLLKSLLAAYADNLMDEELNAEEPPQALRAAPPEPTRQQAEAPTSKAPLPSAAPVQAVTEPNTSVRLAAPPAAAKPKPRPVKNRPHHGFVPFSPDIPLRKMDETRLPFRIHPAAGLTLYTEDNTPITLQGPLMEGQEEAHGGEGDLFLTNIQGQVAKIYNAEHLTAGRRDKLEEMLLHDPNISHLCWPTHMLYTIQGDFVGYTMPQAPQGALPFSKSVLRIGSPNARKELLPDWSRLDLVKAARSAANIVADLHRCNILMGDLNAGNFMVDPSNSENVYVVDTDSFQLGGFPCPVGVEDFTHPGTAQRLGVTGALKFDEFLRTEDEENYVLAIFLFEILFLGQNPFVTKSNMTYREAMAQKEFPYANQNDSFDVPDGGNWMIWKNLTKAVCEAFTETFINWNAVSARQWAKILDTYAYSIQKYGLSQELEPAKYHEFDPENPVFVDLICPYCHAEFNVHKSRYAKAQEKRKKLFCPSCTASLNAFGNDPVSDPVKCSICGKFYPATLRDSVFFSAGIKVYCPDCRLKNKKNALYARR